jgi:hypothetical protein
LSPHLGHRLGDAPAGIETDLVEGAKDGGVRGDRSEEVTTDPQVLDVETALATTGQHQRRLDEYLAAVVQRDPTASPRDPSRQRITEPQSVGKASKGV